MQQGTQRGLSSELFESLKVYLNNSKRLQPIIGLRSITECVKAGSRGGGAAVYLCEVCACRLSKGDMRNHILGTLHRYNYTKARHPHMLSGVKQSGGDMSLLAWPLMNIARTLEDKEGPGDIKLLEVEDAALEMLKDASDSDAISLIKFLMHVPPKPESPLDAEEDEEEEEEHRVVTIGHGEALFPGGNGASWAEETALSFGHTLLDRYSGPKTLIGLFRLTECVGERDGRTYCFLCHCCRARVNTRGFIRHIGGSAHVRSYLMETRPEQLAAAANDGERGRPTDSLVGKVEREEGRGGMEVVKAPQFLCGQLASKSYNWCISRLWKRRYAADHKWSKAKKAGSRVKKPDESVGGKTRVVFKVSLPLTGGPLLLERTSFSQESPPAGPPRQGFDSEPADAGEDDITAACGFEPRGQGVGRPVAREWYNPAYAPWHGRSSAPVEKPENPYWANPPPPVHFQTEYQSLPVLWAASQTPPYQPAGPGGVPGYRGYAVPPRSHPPPHFFPAVSPPAASVPPGPL
ncbi:uncharacterized protein si:ch211-199g17.2 [Phyllopteryx taeniolatus]|uniref:uncharacterized protein si:ch211-199g17.2 n=1 Tax=Phyllopteryx taeniolatus TaxID=161469 RepID=UPI002AD4A3B5|nr:uncharacterized protein si:ch211-199g17.2 [Phyllopteryx taeniolatus]